MYTLKELDVHYLHNFEHEFCEYDIIEAYKNSTTIDEACVLLKTNKIIL